MTCNTCHGRFANRNGVCQCARDIGALVDTMHETARALDPSTGSNPANIVELFRIVNRYNAAKIAELTRKLDALRNEVKAARILGASSPLGFEFSRKQWEDAKEVTDTLNALENK